eukprot:Skav226964  [mRNA]  locus=scaffold51:258639:259586:- [translate_table: standard]
MLMFHGPPSCDQWQVHHKDGSKSNNRLDNLEYVTPSQNLIYSFAASTRLDTWHIQSKPVLWRAIGSPTWERCFSVTAAGKELGLSASTVSKCCHNKSQVKGIEFRFQDLQEPSTEGETWLPMCNPATGAEVPGRFVSSQGRITSPYGHTSQGSLHASGYYRTQVLGQTVHVHRLVASTFLGPAESSRVFVNHKDLNKQNNTVDNLEYVTAAENIAHFHANSSVSRSGGCKPVWSRLCGSDKDWTWHSSMAAAAEVLGVNVGNIWHCLNGNQRRTGDYEFWLAESPAAKSLPGEDWRDVCLPTLRQDKAILRKTFA